MEPRLTMAVVEVDREMVENSEVQEAKVEEGMDLVIA